MPPLTPRQVRRARRWMTIVLLGLFIFIIGVQPDILGLNRSLTVGFVQIGVWLTGLAILLLASYATVRVVRNGKPTSLRADIGTRLLATGYVVAAVASLADFIGVGAQQMPNITFGPVQVIGLVTGVILSLLGVIFYWPRRKTTRDLEERLDEPEDQGVM
jgi:cbb3-type cytochrome oxidase subunit 3